MPDCLAVGTRTDLSQPGQVRFFSWLQVKHLMAEEREMRWVTTSHVRDFILSNNTLLSLSDPLLQEAYKSHSELDWS